MKKSITWKHKAAIAFLLGAAIMAAYGISNVVSAFNDLRTAPESISSGRATYGYNSGCPYCPPAVYFSRDNSTCSGYGSCSGCGSCTGNCGAEYTRVSQTQIVQAE